MAGAGYKLFNVGDVLTAAQVNTYLQEQTVMAFADSAARTAALSGVLAEGMMSYLRDTNAVQVYNGSAWVAVGGSSPLTTKGDLYGFSTVDARVPIGTNNQVLTADSTQALGLKWATPAGAAAESYSLLGTGTTTSGSTVTVSGISGINNIYILLKAVSAGANNALHVRVNGDSSSIYSLSIGTLYFPTSYSVNQLGNYGVNLDDKLLIGNYSTNTASTIRGGVQISGCNSSGTKMFAVTTSASQGGGDSASFYTGYGIYTGSSTISSVSLYLSSGTFDSGSFDVYGSA